MSNQQCTANCLGMLTGGHCEVAHWCELAQGHEGPHVHACQQDHNLADRKLLHALVSILVYHYGGGQHPLELLKRVFRERAEMKRVLNQVPKSALPRGVYVSEREFAAPPLAEVNAPINLGAIKARHQAQVRDCEEWRPSGVTSPYLEQQIADVDALLAAVAWLQQEVIRQTGCTAEELAECMTITDVHKPVVNARQGEEIRKRREAEKKIERVEVERDYALRAVNADDKVMAARQVWMGEVNRCIAEHKMRIEGRPIGFTDELQGELNAIDAALARRPALDECKTRAEKVWRACDTAAAMDRKIVKMRAALKLGLELSVKSRKIGIEQSVTYLAVDPADVERRDEILKQMEEAAK